MPRVRFRMRGDSELLRSLKALAAVVKGKELEKQVLEAAQPIVDGMVASAPRDTGLTADSIHAEARPQRKPTRVRVVMGPSRSRTAVAGYNEFGTSKMPAQPFMRPEWDARSGGLLEELGQRVWDVISSAVKG